MYSFDIFRYDEDLNEKMVGILGMRDEFMISLVKKGFEKNEIRTDLKPEEFAGIISNIIWMSIYKWKLEDRKWNLTETMSKKLEYVLD